MSEIVVTGAAGFIGSHTCDQLLAAGHGVVGLDNFRTGKKENLTGALSHPGFRFVGGDVTDFRCLDQLVAEVQPWAIVHLAGLVSVGESLDEPGENFRMNVAATHTVAEVARRHNVRRVVFASSAAVYGDVRQLPLAEEESRARPISPYGAAKLASEALLLGHAAAFGFVVRCQRYFNVYGPRQDPRSPYSGVISIFCERMAAGKSPTIFGDGEQTRDFISVHDVARANVIAALAPDLDNGIANICTGQPTSLNRLFAQLRRLIAIAGAGEAIHAPAKPGDIRHSRGSPERAKSEMGFSADVALPEGLAELVENEVLAARA